MIVGQITGTHEYKPNNNNKKTNKIPPGRSQAQGSREYELSYHTKKTKIIPVLQGTWALGLGLS